MVRAADQHAALGPQHLGGLVEHDLHEPRVLVLLRGQTRRRAAAAGTEASATTAPSALETTVWAIASTGLEQRPASRERRDDQRGEVVAPAHLGYALQRAREARAIAG